MPEVVESPKPSIKIEENKDLVAGKSLKQKTMERLRKLFKRADKKPLELPMVETPKIPAGSGLDKLIISLKNGFAKDGMNEMQKLDANTQSKSVAGIIEKNYFNFLRRVEDIKDGAQSDGIQSKIKEALNAGNVRVITALAQNEYRNTMDKLVDKPDSMEKEMQNKKIHDKATELLQIRSQAALMGVDTTGIYQDAQRRPLKYWENVLDPKKDSVDEGQEEDPVIVNKKADAELEEALLGPKLPDQTLDQGKKEE